MQIADQINCIRCSGPIISGDNNVNDDHPHMQTSDLGPDQTANQPQNLKINNF